MIQTLLGWITFFVYYLSPGLIIIAATYLFTRKKIKWHKEEIRVLFVPFLIWFLLNLFGSKGKSLSNITEVKYISFGIGFINLLSIVLFRHRDSLKPKFDLIFSILLAILVYLLFPTLPE